MLNKLWSGSKKFLGWFLAIMFFFFALIFFPSIGSVIFIVAGLLFLPVAKLQELISRVIPKSIFKPIIASILFVVACFFVPQTETTSNVETPDNSTVISETATDTTTLEQTADTSNEADAETSTETEQPVSSTENHEDTSHEIESESAIEESVIEEEVEEEENLYPLLITDVQYTGIECWLLEEPTPLGGEMLFNVCVSIDISTDDWHDQVKAVISLLRNQYPEEEKVIFKIYNDTAGLEKKQPTYENLIAIWQSKPFSAVSESGSTITWYPNGAGGAAPQQENENWEPSSIELTQNETPQEPEKPVVSSFSITYLDVGQADAAVIECDGQYMFIDTGNAADSGLIFSYIRNTGIETVEYVLLTHYHEDHIGGAQAVPRAATVKTLLVNGETPTNDLGKETVAYYETNNIPVETVKPGDTLMLGSATIDVYGPIGAYDSVNDTSIVLKITYGNTSFLFTGDAENIAESDIIDADYDIHCDVLKVGHHGSANSTSSAWLKAVDPTYAVISVGEDNGNGHPTGEVLTRLRQAGIVTYRTDLQGDIVCVSDGENITFIVDKNAGVDTLAEDSAGDYVEVVEETPPVEEKPEDTTTEPVVDEGKDYVVNKNTGKYHKPTCSSADDIKPHNRWDYHGTAEELDDMGYEPCKRCKPY